MINAVIIDDEKDARFLLTNFIEKKLSHKLRLLGEADDVLTGIDLIESKKPDLVFLDIQMKTGSGFDLLNHFSSINFNVIFVTAYDQFAIQAFKFSAFDYILKPFKVAEIERAIEKFEQHINTQKSSDKHLKVLIENYGSKGEIHKLIVSNIEGFAVISIDQILRLEGDRNYTHFILSTGKKVTTSKSLGEYEAMLNDYGFYRVHQSTIVSLRYVTAFKRADDGYVEMLDGTIVKVSRSKKQGLIDKFN